MNTDKCTDKSNNENENKDKKGNKHKILKNNSYTNNGGLLFAQGH
jgi:hypothetical protein